MNVRTISVFGISVFGTLVVACSSGAPPTEGAPTGVTSSALTCSGNDCDCLLKEINTLRPQVQACAPGGKGQCGLVLDDVCCPISANGGPIDDFKTAVAEYKKACNAVCPAVVCKDPSNGTCEGEIGSTTSGHCSP